MTDRGRRRKLDRGEEGDRGVGVARFLTVARWNATGAAGVRGDGFGKRTKVLRDMWESMGGRVECVYYTNASTEFDVFAVVEGVTSEQVFAVAKRVNAGGTVERAWAVELLSPEEADQAASTEVRWEPPPPR